MLKAALIPNAVVQHISRYHLGVIPRRFVSGEFIALGVGNRLAPAHYDIEKISRHLERMPERSVYCGTLAYTPNLF
jgi:hypothetical protein